MIILLARSRGRRCRGTGRACEIYRDLFISTLKRANIWTKQHVWLFMSTAFYFNTCWFPRSRGRRCRGTVGGTTVSFHNFKSQNFKLSVSNPESKYVAYVSVLSRISNSQSLGRKKRFENLKTDRTCLTLLVWCGLMCFLRSLIIIMIILITIYIYIYIICICMCICVYIYIHIHIYVDMLVYRKFIFYFFLSRDSGNMLGSQ